METVPIFNDKEGQTIHLPKAYRFTGERVYITRVGSAVVLIPHDAPYSVLIASLDDFTGDFMAERAQPIQREHADPFA